MNIKSLILGSATVALATAGAHAADAIVIAEPEPVEYVRVCDVYGAGFFYIPGTETCLRIGGEARFQVGAANDTDPASSNVVYRGVGSAALNIPAAPAWVPLAPGTDTPNLHGHEADTWNVEARGRFFIDARSQTEWGTLRGYVRVDASRGGFGVANSANNIRTNKAFVELGGFKVGFEDSAWAFTPNAGAANYGSHSDSGLMYGYQQRNLVQYNFSGSNGFFATLSLEDDNRNNVAAQAALTSIDLATGTTLTHLNAVPGYSDNNYVPDVVVKAGVNQAWGAVWAAIGYDEDRTNANTTAGIWGGFLPATQLGDSGWAGQLGVHLNVPSAPGSSFRLIGYYADSDNAYNGHGGQWSILASYWHQFNAQFGASLGVQYIDNLYFGGTDVRSNADAWAVELNTVWEPVQNFQVRTETVYQKADNLDGTWSGFVRFSRFF